MKWTGGIRKAFEFFFFFFFGWCILLGGICDTPFCVSLVC